MPLPVGAVELPGKRGLRSKVYTTPSGPRRLRTGINILHTPDDYAAFDRGDPVIWSDVNTEIGPNFNAWYTVERRGGKMRVSFKRGGHIDFDLDGIPFPAPTVNGDKLEWNDIAPDLDLWIQHRPAGVEVFKRIKGASAPTSLKWNMRERPGSFRVQTATRGRDGAGNEVELTHSITQPTQVGQDRVYDFTEQFTGHAFARDPQTRVKSRVNRFQYPVVIDASFTENIVAEGDDGHSYPGAGTWDNYSITMGYYSYYPGWRFQGIALDGTETIDSSYLYVYVNNVTNGGDDGTLKIDDVDSAAAFSNSSRPPSTSFSGYGCWDRDWETYR